MIKCLRNEPTESERAEERERNHYYRVDQPHPVGVPREDPLGRAMWHDFELTADVDEYPVRGRKLDVFKKMRDHNNAPDKHLEPPSRNLMMR